MLTPADRRRLHLLAERMRTHRTADEQLTADKRRLILELRSRARPPTLREIADELGVHHSLVEAIEKAAREVDQ